MLVVAIIAKPSATNAGFSFEPVCGSCASPFAETGFAEIVPATLLLVT